MGPRVEHKRALLADSSLLCRFGYNDDFWPKEGIRVLYRYRHSMLQFFEMANG